MSRTDPFSLPPSLSLVFSTPLSQQATLNSTGFSNTIFLVIIPLVDAGYLPQTPWYLVASLTFVVGPTAVLLLG